MVKVLISCANGSGTSLMMKMTVEKVLKELNVKVSKIHHCSISEGKSAAREYDVVFCSLNFMNMFEDAQKNGVFVIGIKNVLSAAEIKEQFVASGALEKFSSK